MSNKPKNVIRHRHYDVFTEEEMKADPSLEEHRFDACECIVSEGEPSNYVSGVWDVFNDLWTPTATYEEACFVADRLAHAVGKQPRPIVWT